MKPLLLLLVLCFLPGLLCLHAAARGRSPQGAAGDWTQAAQRGAELFERGSFEEAAKAFGTALAANPPEAELPELRFREVDARWRSLGSSRRGDASELEGALRELRKMFEADVPVEERDELWARKAESLADSAIQIQWRVDANSAWRDYGLALDWWARSSDVDRARERWLGILFKYAWPTWMEDRARYGDWGNWVPLDKLEQALEIAVDPKDRLAAQFLIARTATSNNSGPFWDARTQEAFAAVRGAGREGGLLDAALWFEGQWLEGQGRWKRDDQGNVTREPEPGEALDRYRALTGAFDKSESRFWQQAQQRIEDIQRRELSLGVGRAFYPGSEIVAQLSGRNIESVDHELYVFSILDDVEPRDRERSSHEWLREIKTRGLERVAQWSQALPEGATHGWQQVQARVEPELAPGAYLWIARGGGEEVRELVLVSDAALVAKAEGQDLIVWATHAKSGRPLPGAAVRVHGRVRNGGRREAQWIHADGTTGDDGLARIALPFDAGSIELLVTAQAGDSPTLALLGSRVTDAAAGWRVQVVTDRPAYRPGQQVSWKLMARAFVDQVLTTPAGESLQYTLTGPRGDDLEQGTLTLTAFGSASGEFETAPEMALGEYHMQLRTANGDWISQATLFRLEEYKLPEFEVSVATPEGEDGRRAVFVLGDEVRAEITARTYFGSPVASGTVEAIVRRKPLYGGPQPRRPFDWFESSLDSNGGGHFSRGGHWQPEEEVLRRELDLSADGTATLAFATPFGEGQDYEYTIEARVTDASRREVTGLGSVRVRRQAYTAFVDLPHRVVAPGAPIEATFRTEDANGEPLAVAGTARLLQMTSIEVWIGTDGMPVPASELARARAAGPLPRGWTLLRTDVDYREAARLELRTSDEGEAVWAPTAGTPGVYVVRWSSDDERSGPVTAEASVYVADPSTTDLAYSAPGLSVLVDRSTIAEGETAQVLVMTDASDRHVLFSVEADALMSAEVLHLTGTVKLVPIAIDARHVPNVTLSAIEVRDGAVRTAAEQIVVPPARRFLDVAVTSASETYRPGDEASLAVRVTDADGEPVEAELALSLIDASVLAIQQRYGGDPRSFFWGHRRWNRVQTGSTFDRLSFIELLENESGELIDARFGARGRDELREDAPRGGFETRARKSGLQALGYASESVAAAAPPMERGAMADDMDMGRPVIAPAGQAGAGGSIEVRSDFRETAVWLPELTTAADGTAEVEFTFPDSTTAWEVSASGADAGDRFGFEERRLARTELPLVLRPQLPRFLVAGDEAVFSALLTNTTASPLEATVELELEGLELLGRVVGNLPDGTLTTDGPATVEVPAGGDARVDWRVRATDVGEARVVMRARAGELGDAVERRLPVKPHGIEVLVADAGRLALGRLEHTIEVPPAHPGSGSLTIQVAPSLATTMLDALPYLTHYPYGCLEQTLSRFVPTAIAARTLERLGLEPEFVAEASFGGVEAAFAAKTQPRGRDSWGDFQAAATEGLDKVLSQQRGDGAWSWWPEGPENAWMTGYALWSLSLAREASFDVPESALASARNWIEQNIVREERDPDMQAWLLHAYTASFATPSAAMPYLLPDPLHPAIVKAADGLFANRAGLNASGRALLTLATHVLGRTDRTQVLAENLANGVIRIDPGQGALGGASGGTQMPTAHWGSDAVTWRWAQDGIESTALTLRALLAVQPDHELVVPAMTWLVQNRRAAQWKSTRDTAICVLSLCDYLETSGEAATPIAFRVSLDGEVLGERRLEGAELLTRAASFTIPEPTAGNHTLVVERLEGTGPLYWNAAARVFSAEEPIQPRASQLFVRRDVYRLVGRDTLLAGKLFERRLLQPGDEVVSGERVEVVLTLQATNDFEYLMIEDWKPAGFEATEVKSGASPPARQLRADGLDQWLGEQAERERRGDAPLSLTEGTTGRTAWLYRELRDHAQVFFADRLPEGLWQIRTTLRVEVPGTFHGLPTTAEAMYAPEIRGNSAELKVTVRDAE